MGTPNAIVLITGKSEGKSTLNAFDNALLNAGIGHLNLIKVSSILPPGAKNLSISAPEIAKVTTPGTLVPCVMSSFSSTKSNEEINSCIGIGIPSDPNNYGLIFECSLVGPTQKVEKRVREMLDEAFKSRGVARYQINILSISHVVNHVGCTIAAALLLKIKT